MSFDVLQERKFDLKQIKIKLQDYRALNLVREAWKKAVHCHLDYMKQNILLSCFIRYFVILLTMLPNHCGASLFVLYCVLTVTPQTALDFQ